MYDFKDLFIFEMANNHQGSVEHGKKIIQEMGKITKKYNIKAAVKLQFRHYDTFIHPNMLENKENPKIKRFLSTRLTDDEHIELINEIKENNMLAMVTPFDERSVDLIEKCKVDIIKIGSPSLHDFALLERVNENRKPVIISSGGSNLEHTDNLYSFFKNRHADFALMHCVSIYPTPTNKLNLQNITNFKNRYNVEIGFSTHEDPNNTDAIKIAYSLGARIFEKHVGVETDIIKLNKYSASPRQVENWIQSYIESKEAIGIERIISIKEKEDLNLLYRGVFFNKDIKKGQTVLLEDIYYAFPINKKGILTGEFQSNIIADKDYNKNDFVPKIFSQKKDKNNTLIKYIHEVKGYLNESNIFVPSDSDMEISHHYGIENIFDTGCFISTIVNNNEYANKILVILRGQKHPSHYHLKKDETFYIISGELFLILEGNEIKLSKGSKYRIPRNTVHSFYTNTGCIIEEISTTHYNNDSNYLDPKISKITRSERKTKVFNWVLNYS
tara:strand:- start:1133 stop:2632 length:1500 start_codon:yes stop_codon:yes gene_type:complete